MSIVETVLVFVGIPTGVFALVALVVLGPGAARAPRYRPGGAWDYHPVWYLPNPALTSQTTHHQAVDSADAGSRLALQNSVAEPAQASGGASGEW